MRACVHHVVFYRKETGCLAILEHAARGAQHPGAVADGGHEFALRIHFLHELVGLRMAADMIRRIAPGHYHAIEIGSLGVIIGNLAFHRVAQFAAVGLARFGANRDYRGSGLLEAEQRVPNFHFLVHVVHENCDLLTVKVHVSMVSPCRIGFLAATAPPALLPRAPGLSLWRRSSQSSRPPQSRTWYAQRPSPSCRTCSSLSTRRKPRPRLYLHPPAA